MNKYVRSYPHIYPVKKPRLLIAIALVEAIAALYLINKAW